MRKDKKTNSYWFESYKSSSAMVQIYRTGIISNSPIVKRSSPIVCLALLIYMTRVGLTLLIYRPGAYHTARP